MSGFFGRLSAKVLNVRPSAVAATADVNSSTPDENVREGLIHHRAGRLQEALLSYRQSLAQDPGHFDALHLSGVVLQQRGDSAGAVELIERAIAVAPANASAHNNLAIAYLALNRPRDAEAALRRALAIEPESDRAHNSMGTVMHALGDLDAAERCFVQAVKLNPANAEAIINLGNLCNDRKQLDRAEQFFRKAIAINPGVPENWNRLGNVLQQSGQLDAASDCYQKALALQPENANAHNHVGTVHQTRGELAEAELCFQRALKADGRMVAAMCNLGDVLQRLGRYDEAEKYCREALALRPDEPDALNNLASVLIEYSDLDEAEACCRTALQKHPDHAPAQIKLGTILRLRGRLEEAEACFRDALRIDAESAVAKYNLSMLALLRGDYEQGFRLFESRFDAVKGTSWESPAHAAFLRDTRRWRGEGLAGRRLLIWAEQGFGDIVMMLRYLPLLKKRGAGEVIFHCEPALERLVRLVNGVDRIVSCDLPIAADQYDVHCPILSLACLFGTRVEAVPGQAPYIFVPEGLADAWKKRLSPVAKTKVGVAWAGGKKLRDDARRSIPLRTFEPIMRVDSVRLVSLQKGEESGQIAEARGRMDDWMDECDDFLDTAALIQNLDLVISVDTAVAHLAGALGKPVWLLNRFGSEWRWGLESDRCAWYPSMRIFRQQEASSWAAVIDRVAEELKRFARA